MNLSDTSTAGQRYQDVLIHTELTIKLKRAIQAINHAHPTMPQLWRLHRASDALSNHAATMTWTKLPPTLQAPPGPSRPDPAPPPDTTPPPTPPEPLISPTSLEPLETSEQS